MFESSKQVRGGQHARIIRRQVITATCVVTQRTAESCHLSNLEQPQSAHFEGNPQGVRVSSHKPQFLPDIQTRTNLPNKCLSLLDRCGVAGMRACEYVLDHVCVRVCVRVCVSVCVCVCVCVSHTKHQKQRHP